MQITDVQFDDNDSAGSKMSFETHIVSVAVCGTKLVAEQVETRPDFVSVVYNSTRRRLLSEQNDSTISKHLIALIATPASDNRQHTRRHFAD